MISHLTNRATRSLWIMVAVLLLATAFRFLALDSAPPGWRDDELIEFNMDRRIADGWRPLFIVEAEGHEPVYHYLHAGTILLLGDNLIGYRWLPLACGLLSIALTYALAHKMFGINAALLAAALLAVSFWPIMYSRFGVRHIGVLPWMLGALYLLYPATPTSAASPRSGTGSQHSGSLWESVRNEGRYILAGIFLAAALMTYFAGRAVPIMVIGFVVYLFIFQRAIFRRVWWRYLLTIGIAALIALPMFIEIGRTPGGEKRTEVVGGPLIELRQGNVQPAINTTFGTLGMFTVAGDPEWLYNVEQRPVFDWITGLFFYLGVIICIIRIKRLESGFALIWLIVGLAPAFVSIPAASYSHTIAALPVVYILTAVGIVGLVDKSPSRQGNKRFNVSTYLLVSLCVIAIGAWLTLRDYFGTWANEYIVRFQYHAPTRSVAQWLNQHPEIADVAVGTNPNQLLLDPLALQLDMPRDIPVSWFNADSTVVQPASGPTLFTALQPPGVEVRHLLSATAQLQSSWPEFDIYSFVPHMGVIPTMDGSFDQGRLRLLDVEGVPVQVRPGDALVWHTAWSIQLPVTPGRLKMFLHVLNDKGDVVSGVDREDLNFATLGAGTSFWQISPLSLPGNLPPGRYQVEIGWYDPESGTRLKRDDGSDRYLLQPLEVTTP